MTTLVHSFLFFAQTSRLWLFTTMNSFPASAGIEQIKKTEEEKIGVIRIQTQDFFVMNLQLSMLMPKPAPLPLSLKDY